MLVLPCSNELKYVEGGKCDSRQHVITAAENKEVCSKNLKGEMCSVIDSIEINWDYYNNFFETDNQSCSNKNMIEIMFDIISATTQTRSRSRSPMYY